MCAAHTIFYFGTVVQIAETARRAALPAEIRSDAGAGLANAEVAGRGEEVVVEFLAAAVAHGGQDCANDVHDANGCEWVRGNGGGFVRKM